jgi:serine/threonine-protein phosphatase CPPED1
MKLVAKKSKFLLGLFSIILIVLLAANSRPATKAFTFAQLCDPQLGFGESYEKDVDSFKLAVEGINKIKPDFLVICGDMVNSLNKKSVSDFKKIASGLKMRFYCCPGNHDAYEGDQLTEKTLSKYREAFGKDYFSFDHKGFTFIVANTCLWKVSVDGESQKHDSWFRQTLETARTKKMPVFFIGHHPLYAKSPDEPDGYFPLPARIRTELLGLFESSKVVAALTGHAHQLIVNNYKGIQLVSGESTSRNLDNRPFGFRVWKVKSPDSITNEFTPLRSEDQPGPAIVSKE